MKKKDPEEQNRELRELGRAIASFFERKEDSAEAEVLLFTDGACSGNPGTEPRPTTPILESLESGYENDGGNIAHRLPRLKNGKPESSIGRDPHFPIDNGSR